jgi:hypothetical protein
MDADPAVPRDASGRDISFDYGNPIVKNITFTRLSDRKNA